MTYAVLFTSAGRAKKLFAVVGRPGFNLSNSVVPNGAVTVRSTASSVGPEGSKVKVPVIVAVSGLITKPVNTALMSGFSVYATGDAVAGVGAAKYAQAATMMAPRRPSLLVPNVVPADV
jgi:hypothetical protein